MNEGYSGYTFSGKHKGGSAALCTYEADYVHAYYFGEVRVHLAALEAEVADERKRAEDAERLLLKCTDLAGSLSAHWVHLPDAIKGIIRTRNKLRGLLRGVFKDHLDGVIALEPPRLEEIAAALEEEVRDEQEG